MTGDEATLDLTVNTLILSLYQHIQDLHLKKIDAEGYDSQTQISYMLLSLGIHRQVVPRVFYPLLSPSFCCRRPISAHSTVVLLLLTPPNRIIETKYPHY